MHQYLDVLKEVLENGCDTEDRTGTGRRRIWGTSKRFDLSNGKVPVVTTRQIFLKGVITELLWFISGSTDNRELKKDGVKFWDRWAVEQSHIDAAVARIEKDESPLVKSIDISYFKAHYQSYLGSIGPMYGAAWRAAPGPRHGWDIAYSDLPPDLIEYCKTTYPIEYQAYLEDSENNKYFETIAKTAYNDHVDQFNDLLINLRDRPYSSRHVVVAWIPQWTPSEKLKPQENVLAGYGSLAACHCMYQCFVKPPKEEGGKKRLSLLIYIRSNDLAIGAPTNIAQYAVLTHMLARHLDMDADELIWQVGDAHLYLNHIENAKVQITLEPLESPTIWLNPEIKSIWDFKAEDIEIRGYTSHPPIKYELST